MHSDIDVYGEAEIVASDVRSGKKANEVVCGRQDIDFKDFKRNKNRTHGRAALNISNFNNLNQEKRRKGYDGYSMSNNARTDYANGEMPLSKWSKSEIDVYQLSAVKGKKQRPLLPLSAARLLQSKALSSPQSLL